MKPWTWSWFATFIAWCRCWSWFDQYIYGKSVNLEDFVRNPAEVLRDTIPPFVFKDVKPYSLFCLRIGFIPFDPAKVATYAVIDNNTQTYFGTYWNVTKMLGRGLRLGYLDLRYLNPWYTKYPNAAFMLQVAISFKWFIPIPYISLVIRYSTVGYFQFGLGWGAQKQGYLEGRDNGKYDASLCGKLRFVDYNEEAKWNPGADVYGYYEGTC